MKKMHLLLYKYRVSMGIVPVVAGILYFVLDENRRFSKTMLGIGATVMSIGIVLRIWTAMYNWENINSVEPIATNGIITNGPYRYCRNPMYFSAIILTLGFSLIFGSWQVVLIAVLPTIVVHLHQIYVEERYLINICDEFYDLYKQKNRDCVCVRVWDDKATLKNFGIALLDKEGKVLEIEEKPEQPKSNTVVFASYFYKKDTVPLFKQYLAEGNNPDAPGNFPAWLYKQKEVYAYTFPGECYDIGTLESYEEVQKLFQK